MKQVDLQEKPFYFYITDLLLGLGIFNMVTLLIFKYNCYGCNTIHNTPWGRPFGIPIAIFGLVGFVAIFYLLRMKELLLASIVVIFGVFVSVFLIFAQVFVLKTICPLCLISEICLILVWLLIYLQEKNKPFRVLSVFLLILIMASTFQFLYYNSFGVKVMNTISDHMAKSSTHLMQNGGKVSKYNIPKTMRLINDNMEEIELDITKNYVLFFSSDCVYCNRTIKAVSFLPENKRPILVDVWIPEGISLNDEKKRVQMKLSYLNIDHRLVLYDFQRRYSLGVPTLVEGGKLLDISKALNEKNQTIVTQ